MSYDLDPFGGIPDLPQEDARRDTAPDNPTKLDEAATAARFVRRLHGANILIALQEGGEHEVVRNEVFPDIAYDAPLLLYGIGSGGYSLTNSAWLVDDVAEPSPSSHLLLTYGSKVDFVPEQVAPGGDALEGSVQGVRARLARTHLVGPAVSALFPLESLIGKGLRPWIMDPASRPLELSQQPCRLDLLVSLHHEGESHDEPPLRKGLAILALDALSRHFKRLPARVLAATKHRLDIDLYGYKLEVSALWTAWRHQECPVTLYRPNASIEVNIQVAMAAGEVLASMLGGEDAEWQVIKGRYQIGQRVVARYQRYLPHGLIATIPDPDFQVVCYLPEGERTHGTNPRALPFLVGKPGKTTFEAEVLNHDDDRCALCLGLREIVTDPWQVRRLQSGQFLPVAYYRVLGIWVLEWDIGCQAVLNDPAFSSIDRARMFGWARVDQVDRQARTISFDKMLLQREGRVERKDTGDSVVRFDDQSEAPLVDDPSAQGQNRICVHLVALSFTEGKPLCQVSQVAKVADASGRMVVRQFFPKNLSEGMVTQGRVKSLKDYGAFVDLGSIDGLLHITDMSYGRIRHPAEFCSVGDILDVKVLKIDREKGRVSLGCKQLYPDPWENAALRYPEGSIVQGTVVNLTDYGAFIEIEPGLEGLLRVSDMCWGIKLPAPADVVALGEKVRVLVLKYDLTRRRLSLGLKQLTPNPWHNLPEQFSVGSIIEGSIGNVTGFGVFVNILGPIDGLVHISSMPPNFLRASLGALFSEGQNVQVRVLEIDIERERCSLELVTLGDKSRDEIDWDVLKPGRQLQGVIKGQASSGLLVDVGVGVTGIVEIGNLNAMGLETDDFQPGTAIRVEVFEADLAKKELNLVLETASGTISELLSRLQPGEIVRAVFLRWCSAGALVASSGNILTVGKADLAISTPDELYASIKPDEEIELKVVECRSSPSSLILSRRAQRVAASNLAGRFSVGSTHCAEILANDDDALWLRLDNDLVEVVPISSVIEGPEVTAGLFKVLFPEGHNLDVRVEKVDVRRHRVWVSHVEVQKEARRRFLAGQSFGQRLSVQVVARGSSALWIRLEANLLGAIDFRELCWFDGDTARALVEVMPLGVPLEAVVCNDDLDGIAVRLSIRAATDDPWLGAAERHKVDDEVVVEPLAKTSSGWLGRLDDGLIGLLSRKEYRKLCEHEEVGEATETIPSSSATLRIKRFNVEQRMLRFAAPKSNSLANDAIQAAVKRTASSASGSRATGGSQPSFIGDQGQEGPQSYNRHEIENADLSKDKVIAGSSGQAIASVAEYLPVPAYCVSPPQWPEEKLKRLHELLQDDAGHHCEGRLALSNYLLSSLLGLGMTHIAGLWISVFPDRRMSWGADLAREEINELRELLKDLMAELPSSDEDGRSTPQQPEMEGAPATGEQVESGPAVELVSDKGSGDSSPNRLPSRTPIGSEPATEIAEPLAVVSVGAIGAESTPSSTVESENAGPENYDCFLSHNSADKPGVRALAKHLRARGLSVWLDEERLRPGVPWQPLLEAGIQDSRSIAVLVGRDGLGPWEQVEMRAALSFAVREGRPVIPVLLADAPAVPQLPLFLRAHTWVDFRSGGEGSPSGLDRLVWGITGSLGGVAEDLLSTVSAPDDDRGRRDVSPNRVGVFPPASELPKSQHTSIAARGGLPGEWDVFIVYARPDREWASTLFGRLAGRARVFADWKVELGQFWPERISQALKGSAIIAVLVSKNSAQAVYQQEEIHKAIALVRKAPDGRRLVPVFLDQESRMDSPYGLGVYQGLDWFEPEHGDDVANAFLELLEALPGTASTEP